jgi:hypothetical protein
VHNAEYAQKQFEFMEEEATAPSLSESRQNWGPEHGRGNIPHNDAIETELDWAAGEGATSIRKSLVQRNAVGERVYAPDGSYLYPDASYVLDGIRYNTNYVSNLNDLEREIRAFEKMSLADADAVHTLMYRY